MENYITLKNLIIELIIIIINCKNIILKSYNSKNNFRDYNNDIDYKDKSYKSQKIAIIKIKNIIITKDATIKKMKKTNHRNSFNKKNI